MVRKIAAIFLALTVLLSCVSTIGQCANYSVYDNGTISSTYITYFKDILANQSILDDYVGFRSGQYTYTLAVGDMTYNGAFSGSVKIYEFNTNSGSYNQSLTYNVFEDSNFKLSETSTVLYSNLGDYPSLIERGANYEVLSTILLCVLMLSVVINRIFYYRKSR